MLAERANYEARMMARVLEVSRSGFYRWLKDHPCGEDPWGEVRERVEEIWLKSDRRFGARSVHYKLLADPDPKFNTVTIYRVRECMRELGIRGTRPNAKKRTTVPDEDAPARPDLLMRDFTSPVPTYKLVGDITYLRTLSGLTCLATVIDLATRMVVGWAIADNMRTPLAMGAMEMAYGRGYVAGNAIFHSDRGSQYTSKMFSDWAAEHDVRLSMGRTGSCHDNAVAESFLGTLKNERPRDEGRPPGEATTKHLATGSVESYHGRFHPHPAVGGRVPAEPVQEFFDRMDAAA